MTSELKFKQHYFKTAYKFFATIHMLQLGKLANFLKTVHPTMNFVDRQP